MIKSAAYFSLFLFLIFQTSCTDKIAITEFEKIADVNYKVFDIELNSENQLVACGGEYWDYGFISITDLTDFTTEVDSVSKSAVFDIDINENGDIAACGIYRYFYKSSDEWNVFYTPESDILHQIIYEENRLMIVGGAGLSTGAYYDINTVNGEVNRTDFDRELASVYSNDDTMILGGFGAIYCQEEQENFDIKHISGDYFLDMESDGSDIVILGETGKMYIIDTKGNVENEINPPFYRFSGISDVIDLAIFDGEWFVSARENTIWKSKDRGENWQKLSIEDQGDILSIEKKGDYLYFGTSNGIIGRILD